jgi:hypothetical protein
MGLFKRRKKMSPEEMREEIVRLIDESREPIYKVAFYSQEEVQEILGKLEKRWEESRRVGRPIDYATEEELEVLYKIAKRIASKTPEELWAEYGAY